MAATDHLLPSNASPLERALSRAAGRFAPAPVIPGLWNAYTCPAALLPHLAWALAVDDWDPTWGEDRKRDAIANARYIHQHKGTLAAVRRALAVMGHPDAVIIERSGNISYDGAATYNGVEHYAYGLDWAVFKVTLNRPVTIDQAAAITTLINRVKRNCVHLAALDFSQAALRYGGAATYNGTYSHGTV